MLRKPASRSVLLALLFLLTISVLNGIWYLGTRSYLNSEDLQRKLSDPELSITWDDASSPFPGLFWVENFRLHARDNGLEWTLHLKEGSVFLRLLPLRDDKALISWLTAEGGRLSFLVLPDAKDEEKKSVAEKAAEKERESADAWDVELDRISLDDLQEVTVNGYRLQGKSRVHGAIDLGRNGDFSVSNLALDIPHADAFLDDAKFGHLRNSSVTLSLDTFNEYMDKADEIGKKLKADLRFDAELVDLSPLKRPLSSLPWLDLRSAEARATGRIRYHLGEFVAPSTVNLDSKDIRARFLSQEAQGAAKLSWAVQEEQPKSLFSLVFEEFGLRRLVKKENELEGKGLRLVVQSQDTWRIGKLQDWEAEIIVPRTEMKSLAYLNIFLPKGFGLQIDSGKGHMESRMRADSKGRGGGFFRVRAQDIGLVYEKTRIRSHLKSDFHFAAVNLENGSFQLKDSDLQLENLMIDNGDKRTENWSGRLAIPTANIRIEEPMRFAGHVSMQGKDLSPLLTLYGAGRSLPDWIEEAVNLKDVRVDFDAKADPTTLSVDNLRAKAEKIKLEGWYKRENASPVGKLLVEYGKLEGAIGVKGEELEWKLINAREWYSGR